MAVNCTINSITLQSDGSSGVNYLVGVTFNDAVSGFQQIKNYAFPSTNTIAQDRAVIQADLNLLKTSINAATALQQYVGTVLN